MIIKLHSKGILHNFDESFMKTHFTIYCGFNQLCYRNLKHNCELCSKFDINICHFKEQGIFDLTKVFEFYLFKIIRKISNIDALCSNWWIKNIYHFFIKYITNKLIDAFFFINVTSMC